MIGNAEEAQFIEHWYRNVRDRYDYGNTTAPEGWTYLGEGCYRTAYLAPSGVVYKVQQSMLSDGWQTNEGEWENWKRIYISCKMPKHSRLPKLTYFPVGEKRGVIAIERFTRNLSRVNFYAAENGVDYWQVRDQIGKVTGLADLGGSNLFVDDETKQLVPTDLGADQSDW